MYVCTYVRTHARTHTHPSADAHMPHHLLLGAGLRRAVFPGAECLPSQCWRAARRYRGPRCCSSACLCSSAEPDDATALPLSALHIEIEHSTGESHRRRILHWSHQLKQRQRVRADAHTAPVLYPSASEEGMLLIPQTILPRISGQQLCMAVWKASPAVSSCFLGEPCPAVIFFCQLPQLYRFLCSPHFCLICSTSHTVLATGLHNVNSKITGKREFSFLIFVLYFWDCNLITTVLPSVCFLLPTPPQLLPHLPLPFLLPPPPPTPPSSFPSPFPVVQNKFWSTITKNKGFILISF